MNKKEKHTEGWLYLLVGGLKVVFHILSYVRLFVLINQLLFYYWFWEFVGGFWGYFPTSDIELQVLREVSVLKVRSCVGLQFCLNFHIKNEFLLLVLECLDTLKVRTLYYALSLQLPMSFHTRNEDSVDCFCVQYNYMQAMSMYMSKKRFMLGKT